jgi:hypothetical protein
MWDLDVALLESAVESASCGRAAAPEQRLVERPPQCAGFAGARTGHEPCSGMGVLVTTHYPHTRHAATIPGRDSLAGRDHGRGGERADRHRDTAGRGESARSCQWIVVCVSAPRDWPDFRSS